MRLFALSPNEVEAHWEDFAELFARFERDCRDVTAERIKKNALAETMQVWGLQDDEQVHGIVVTEIQESVVGKVCVVVAACGGVRVPLQERMLDTIADWAKSIGCVKLRYMGRKGWLRRFKRFEPVGVVAEWAI